MNNKLKGNLAVASAIAHFVGEGYTVGIPLADTAKYDLVMERDGSSRQFSVSTQAMKESLVFMLCLCMYLVVTVVQGTAG